MIKKLHMSALIVACAQFIQHTKENVLMQFIISGISRVLYSLWGGGGVLSHKSAMVCYELIEKCLNQVLYAAKIGLIHCSKK